VRTRDVITTAPACGCPKKEEVKICIKKEKTPDCKKKVVVCKKNKKNKKKYLLL
jgi:hypothetical protein